MKVLVTGGAGYIGSQMVIKLLEAGHKPIVVDDLSKGSAALVNNAPLHIINLGDTPRLDALFRAEKFDIVMHFAAFIEVGESVKHPDKYYINNFMNTLALLNTMRQHEVHSMIFSSTAAIFGEPSAVPVDEHHPKNPINPYGMSKLMCEQLLQDYDIAYGIKSICLRYFNAAGADSHARVGYRTQGASHLIPAVLQTALGLRQQVDVFGRDYDTPDGTCIRDYIHVMDLCHAHLLAMNFLKECSMSRQYNLGNARGYSVQEVIDAAKKMTGKEINSVDAPRRPGDPAKIIADSRLIQQELGWQPHYPDIKTIIEHAYSWERKAMQETNQGIKI